MQGFRRHALSRHATRPGISEHATGSWRVRHCSLEARLPEGVSRASPTLSVPRTRGHHSTRANAAAGTLPASTILPERYWTWRGHRIRYKSCGSEGPCIVLVHGFGANCDHWRKNISELAQKHRVFAVDLLGYGYSDKPSPRVGAPHSIYTFENWAEQLLDFIDEIVGKPSYIVCNSVGGVAGLQAGVFAPAKVKAVQILNISLRGLNLRRQKGWQRPFVRALQRALWETPIGAMFFNSVAKHKTVKKILKTAYGRKNTVTDELVDIILKPGLQPGAADVFLDFVTYSQGPLPEDLLEKISVPVSFLWGELDPWENINLGRERFEPFPAVEEFIRLPGVGHCPHDEAPELVNPLIESFIARHE